MVFFFAGIIQRLSWIFMDRIDFKVMMIQEIFFGRLLPFHVAIAWFCVGSLHIGGILFDHNVLAL